jgi:hypothetical protein
MSTEPGLMHQVLDSLHQDKERRETRPDSSSSEPGSRVRLLSERPARPSTPMAHSSAAVPPSAPSTQPAAVPTSTPSGQDFLQQAAAMLVAFGAIVASRLILLLGGLGAFVVVVMALRDPSPMMLAVAISYDVFVFIPLVWLTWQGAGHGNGPGITRRSRDLDPGGHQG